MGAVLVVFQNHWSDRGQALAVYFVSGKNSAGVGMLAVGSSIPQARAHTPTGKPADAVIAISSKPRLRSGRGSANRSAQAEDPPNDHSGCAAFLL